VACAAQGDLFCRECALANLLAQRKEIKRAARQREAEEREKEEGREKREQEEDERNLQIFEAVQNGLEGRVDGWKGKREREKAEEEGRRKRRRSETGGGGTELEKRDSFAQANLDGTSSKVLGSKPNFQLSEEAIVRIAADERAKARKAIEDEKVCRALAFMHRLCRTRRLTRISIVGGQAFTALILDTLRSELDEQQRRYARS
jgi:nitric oxide synthase-interacting protein